MLTWILAVMVFGPGPGSELHVASVYESYLRVKGQNVPQDVFVVVRRPGKDITLFLSGYEPATWRVLVAPGTNLKKVILGGYHQQSVIIPKGVEVVEAFYESKKRPQKEYVYADHNIDSGRFRFSAQAIRELTGQELSSFQGSYSYDGTKPFIVNTVQTDERLDLNYPRLTPAGEVPKVAFQAVWFTHLNRADFAPSFGDYTQAGPDKDALKPLPKNLVRIAYDPAGKRYYGLARHEIHEVDLKKGISEKMNPGKGLPKVSWPCGITYDTKRDRLIVATLGGVGWFYTYSPKTGVWAAPANLNNIDLAALAYHAKDDMLYGLASDLGENGDGGMPVLHQFNALGTLVKTIHLDLPMFPGVLGQGFGEPHVQLISADDHLAVVVAGLGSRGENGKYGKGESFLYLVDPKTAKVKLAWKE